MLDIASYLMDLIENAKAASAKRIAISFYENQDTLKFAVENDGEFIGDYHRLTNPFYTTKKTKKTGFGLPLLNQYAMQCDGKMTIETKGNFRIEVILSKKSINYVPLGDIASCVAIILLDSSIDLSFMYDTDQGHFDFQSESSQRSYKSLIEMKEKFNTKLRGVRRSL